MKVTYPGPADTVNLPRLGITATRGEPIDVPTETGEQLILQGWKPAKKTTKTQENQ